MQDSKNLHWQQPYIESFKESPRSIKNNFPLWDYIFLTASNETQANAYRIQIEKRLESNKPQYAKQFVVLPDPEGLRVGSGGATLNVIRYIHEQEGGFEQIRALVIHSGGDSKRIPQYSALGKLFSPVPKVLTGNRRSTLFDELLAALEEVPQRMAKPGILICSGDVMLSFNPLQIEGFTQNAVALSIRESARTGTRHGVYLRDEMGCVGRFLHKQLADDLEAAGAVDAQGQVDIDTGAVILDHHILNSLYGLVDTKEKFATFVNECARLSFYADFLYPLASGSTLEQYYRETPEGSFTPELRVCRAQLWDTLHKYRLKLIRLSQARFIHFGTTGELLQLMTVDMPRYKALGWNSRTLTNSIDDGFATNGAYISTGVQVGCGSYIEDSVLLPGSVVGEGCIISGITLSGQMVPPGAVLHGLKLRNGRFVVRMYGVDDDPKQNQLFGIPLSESLWTAPLYPIFDTVKDALEATLNLYRLGFVDDRTSIDRISLKDSFNLADQQALLDWQDEVSDRVNLLQLLQAIDGRLPLREPMGSLGHLSSRGEGALLSEAKQTYNDLAGFGKRIRIYYALAHLVDDEKAGKYHQKVFTEINEVIHRQSLNGSLYSKKLAIRKDEVVVRLPVRVNFGGGWSDTPPYCQEQGGFVLNAAITLGGDSPAEAVVRKLDEPMVVLASADSDSYEEFSDIALLQHCSDPLDPFALHKAALMTCGLISQRAGETLEQVLERLGGGIYLSTQVKNIPRGSGLGTSSILGGACVKALSEFSGISVTEMELFSRVLCMEQLMSTGGGWQDQAGGLIPGIKLLSSDPGLEQIIRYRPAHILPEAMKALQDRFCLIYTGQRRLARTLLRDVVGRYLSGEKETLDTLYGIQRLAVLMMFELEKGNVTHFGSLLSEHWAMSKRLDAGCTNDTIEEIFSAVDDLVDGKMICGAGGGGFLQVILKLGVSKDNLRARLRESQLNDTIDVWDSEFVM